MLSARVISYTNPSLGGPAGIYVRQMLDQLGIGEQMKAKAKLFVADPRVDYSGGYSVLYD